MSKTKEVNKTNTPYLDELIAEAKENNEESISISRSFSGMETSELHLEDLLEIKRVFNTTNEKDDREFFKTNAEEYICEWYEAFYETGEPSIPKPSNT
jgi:hypothetical protein